MKSITGIAKKVSHLKRQLTNRELQPQELNRNQRNRTTDIRKVEANRTTSVGNQPPASQPTAKNTAIHNACMPQAEGQRCKGRPKNTLFVLTFLVFGQKKKEDFLRLAQRTLVSYDLKTCNFALCFGVFVKTLILCFLFLFFFSSCG
ncbi:MAG: hypothetical protein HC888_18375 [Candidatus Competibacteraceae bacterium]|nr:hypothetical protein [Candidatus Competibacteraceae bacterium]